MIMSIIFMSTIGLAQKITPDKVPANVKQALMKEYPKAGEAAWRMDDNNYQAMFTMNGNKYAAKFDKNGIWIDKEERIVITDVPKDIRASIAKNFAGFTVYEAEKVEANGKGILYNVGLEKEKEFLEVHLSPAGDVLDKVTKTKKTEWGKDND